MAINHPAYHYIRNHRFEILLISLLMHLFCGILVPPDYIIARLVFVVMTLFVSLASINISIRKRKRSFVLQVFLFAVIVSIPLLHEYFENITYFRHYFSIPYSLFFLFIFYEISLFLLKPKEITTDLILAATCGYLVLLEIFVFVLEYFIHANPNSLHGVNLSSPMTIMVDLVYFCSITMSSIGYGDITPLTHEVKLLTSFMGISGQFYLIVVLGIMISKFTRTKN